MVVGNHLVFPEITNSKNRLVLSDYAWVTICESSVSGLGIFFEVFFLGFFGGLQMDLLILFLRLHTHLLQKVVSSIIHSLSKFQFSLASIPTRKKIIVHWNK
jgi:hypothetical protein